MKRCPTCNQTYADNAMSFCLDDGAPLLSVPDAPPPQPPSFDPNATVPFIPARDTTPQSNYGQGTQMPGAQPPPSYGSGQYPPPSSGGSSGQYPPPSGQFPPPSGQFPPPPGSQQYQPGPSWSPMSGATVQPAKKGSALPWIIGGAVLLIVLGIGAVAIIAVIAGMSGNSNNRNANNSNAINRNSRNTNLNSNSNSNSNSNANSNSNVSAPPGTLSMRDDFSNVKWWVGANEVGSCLYVSGEYHLKAAGGYMVIYGPDSSYRTEDATTRVTVRSVTGDSPQNGYGLTVFGELKNRQLEDYAFLIRNEGTPSYKVVMHRGGQETTLINWTNMTQIRTGTSPNQIEVRAKGEQLTFYVNGQYATSVTATSGYSNGLVGFYSSGTEEVAFDDLEFYK